jgi:hypothetical protein
METGNTLPSQTLNWLVGASYYIPIYDAVNTSSCSDDDEAHSYPENIGVIEVTIGLTLKELAPKPGSQEEKDRKGLQDLLNMLRTGRREHLQSVGEEVPLSLLPSDEAEDEDVKRANEEMKMAVLQDAPVPETAKKFSSHRVVLQGVSCK